jgi:hypothetical protein
LHDDQETAEEENVNSIHNMHKQLLQNIKQIKSYYFVQETITRTAVRYTEFLIRQKGTGTKEIIA